MEIKNNLLVKDLRFYSWFLNLREALIAISTITAKEIKKYPDTPDSGDFTLLLKNKGLVLLNEEKEGGIKDVGFQHFKFLDNLDDFYFFNMKSGNKGFVVKDGVLALEITEPYVSEVIISKHGETGTELEELTQTVQYPGTKFLGDFLEYSLTTGFALPSLINDLYEYSLENNQSTEVEEIFFKAGLELPEVIDELVVYARKFAFEFFRINGGTAYFHNLNEKSDWHINYRMLRIALGSDEEKDLTPFARELLKVVTKIPFHLKEYFEFFKLSLKDKDYSSEFEYFFKLLSKYEDSLDKIKVSNEVWKLLMYNSPLPLKIFNEKEEARARRKLRVDKEVDEFLAKHPELLRFYNNPQSEEEKEKEKKLRIELEKIREK